MPFVFKRLALLLSITAALAADKDSPFKPLPIDQYTAKQTNDSVTVAAKAYMSSEEAKSAFGKNNPYNYGILPVLVLIRNGSKETVSVDKLITEFVTSAREKVEATPARDVKFTLGPKRPSVIAGPAPRLPKIGKTKNPLDSWEIEGRAFSAKMLPPGETASGFFYFQTGMRRGARLYLSGVRETGSGKSLFYFEVPLE